MFLLQYHTTSYAAADVTPSFLIMGCVLSTRPHLLEPDVGKHVRNQQLLQTVCCWPECSGAEHVRGSSVGSWYTCRPVSYLVRVNNGDEWRWHVDHIRDGGGRFLTTDEEEDSLILPQTHSDVAGTQDTTCPEQSKCHHQSEHCYPLECIILQTTSDRDVVYAALDSSCTCTYAESFVWHYC